jgi:zinc protease
MGDEKSLSGKNDVAYLASRMLKYGTTTRSRKDISDELDKNKTSIYFGGGANVLYANVNTDKEHFDKAMDLLQDMLLHPSFDAKEFDKLTLDAKADLESSMSDPSTLASESLTKAMNKYPEGHPFYPRTSKEQLAALKNVTLDQIKEYYNGFYGANHGYASFVGSVDADQVKSLLEKSFNKWNSKADFKDIEELYFNVNGDLQTIQVDDKANATLMGGININMTQKDPDYIALAMANEMLGGGAFLSSRIPQRLREAEGMSYGAGSFLDMNYRYPSGSLGFYAIFNPSFKDKLNGALKEEIQKALDKGFTKDEWKSSLDSWLQQRKMALDNNNGLAGILTKYMVDGKVLDFYSETEAKAKALTLDQINAALKKYLDPNKIIFIYAGDFRKKD